MAASSSPKPQSLRLHGRSRTLEVAFDDGQSFALPFELLRVYSPSAEVRGHGSGQEQLQSGKRMVDIERVEPVGHYAVRLYFSDGHHSGIYAWSYLHHLGAQQQSLWQDYERRLSEAGASRDEAAPLPTRVPASCAKGCA